MPETVTFTDPFGEGKPIELETASVPKDLADHGHRVDHIPEPDPYYVDLGMLYRLASLEVVRRTAFADMPLHLALRGHMGTGKDHDLEQFAALLRLPYYRIPLTGEVRDITLIGSVKLHGDGKGGTESRWQDGDITRALRGPALINLSELNAAGAETLFALHGLLDRHRALELPTGEMVRLRNDVRVYGTLNPTDLRDYAGTQTLNKAFADRWIIWEKDFPGREDAGHNARTAPSGAAAGVSRPDREPGCRGQRLFHLDRCTDQGRDPDESTHRARPGPGRTAHLRRSRRPAAAFLGGVRPPPHRRLRPRPLRNRLGRSRPPRTGERSLRLIPVSGFRFPVSEVRGPRYRGPASQPPSTHQLPEPEGLLAHLGWGFRDVGKGAVALGIVQPVADDPDIGDREAEVIELGRTARYGPVCVASCTS